MRACLVVVADGGHSRFFLLEDTGDDPLSENPRLRQKAVLENPEARKMGSEVYTGKAGTRSGPAGHTAGGTDDHRDAHDEVTRKRFVDQIASQARELAPGGTRVVVVADPRTLGMLRPALSALKGEVKELAKDLCHLSPSELQDRLAADGLVPARKHQ